jgi:hypothetical protein
LLPSVVCPGGAVPPSTAPSIFRSDEEAAVAAEGAGADEDEDDDDEELDEDVATLGGGAFRGMVVQPFFRQPE